MPLLEVLKEVFGGPEESKLKTVAPPTDQSGFMGVLKEVFSADTAKTLTEEVIPGTSDVVSAGRAVSSLGEAGAAIRKGDVTGALKGYADAATNAIGALPMVPAIGGILTGARGAAKGIDKITDKLAYFKPDIKLEQGESYKLKDIYNNPELFKLYPELKNLKVTMNDFITTYRNPNTIAVYLSGSNEIMLSSKADKTALIHELQHAVDRLENPDVFKDYISAGKDNINYKEYIEQLSEQRAIQAQEEFRTHGRMEAAEAKAKAARNSKVK